MYLREQCEIDVPAGISLRQELSIRALRLAAATGSLHARTDGGVPGIVFGRDDRGRHGNFHPESYRRICASEAWARRLEKVHTAYRKMRPRADWPWKELDCSNSSDALLMNIFCFPEVMESRSIRALLCVENDAQPEFGFKARVPLHGSKRDATEIDMKIGELLVEAKLTESNFQMADSKLLARYRDLESVFDLAELPVRNGRHAGYQLVRGALAAYASGCSFCVLCDARRRDLMETWFQVLRAVGDVELRSRLKLLTWQELAGRLAPELQDFLEKKYGIRAEL